MNASPDMGASRREISAFVAALVALWLVALVASNGVILLTRPLWVDEWLTVFVANRASPAAVIADLGHAADGGASLVHLGAWLMRAVTGPLTPVKLHALSLACVLLALVLVFVVLRRRFGVLAAAAGAFAVGANPVVVEHSYEGRFYGPWLLACAFFAWTLPPSDALVVSRRRSMALAFAAACLCTVHFYGVISLSLMVVAAVASRGRHWREGLRAIRWAAAGLLAMLLVVPLAMAQRRAYTVPSWLPDFSLQQLAAMAQLYWTAAVPAVAAVVVITKFLFAARPEPTAPRDRLDEMGIAALLGLALMPLALATLSVLGQPSMLDRYAVVTALAWAPFVAVAASLFGTRTATLLAVVAGGFWISSYRSEARARREFAESVSSGARSYAAALTMRVPVVFQSSHVMYAVLGPDWIRGRSPPGAFLALDDATTRALFPDSATIGQLNRGTILERDLARVHASQWGFPVLAQQSALQAAPRFILVAPAARLPVGFSGAEHFIQVMFPHHLASAVAPDVFLLERGSLRP